MRKTTVIGIGQAAFVAFLPKCPACLAADLSFLGALGISISIPVALYRLLPRVSLALAAVCLVAAGVQRFRLRRAQS